MISSREILDLHPQVQIKCKNFIARAEELTGAKILVTCTLRDAEAQDGLYAQGRTKPGPVVTNARGGDSFHQYGLAFDIVPLRSGKPIWDTNDPIWETLGSIGEEEGLEWAGHWTHFREFPHFQYTGGLMIADLKAGKDLDFPGGTICA